MNFLFRKVFTVIIAGLSPILFLKSGQVAADERPVRVGVIAPQSGEMAYIGNAQHNAAQLVAEDDEKMSEHLEIFFQDSFGTDSVRLEAYRTLVKEKHVDMLYVVGDAAARLLAPLAEKDSVPFFAVDADLRTVSSLAFSSLFFNERGEFARALWDELRRGGKKRIAIVREPSGLNQILAQAMADNAMGAETVSIEAKDASLAKNQRAIIRELEKSPPDVIGIFLPSQALKSFIEALGASASKYTLITPFQFSSIEEVRAFEPILRDVLFVMPHVTDPFRERYEKRYKDASGLAYGARFYDFLTLADEIAVNNSPALSDRKELLTAFRFEDQRLGATGPYCVKTTARLGVYYSFPLALYKFKDGALTVLRMFEHPV